jgi:uncharacterized metal-binding protein YceD (DUF177 family)
MKNKIIPSEPELSRPLRIEKISPNGVEEIIHASERERQALTERFDLIEIKKLEAKLQVTPEQAGTNYLVKGSLSAEVVQRCVVTLDPLPAKIEQPIHVHFAAPEILATGANERAMDEDDMEPIANGIIDLGELVAQHLGLGLNPYPRKPDVPPVEIEFGQAAKPANPFLKLTVLHNKTKE